jgi:hypothetical protein
MRRYSATDKLLTQSPIRVVLLVYYLQSRMCKYRNYMALSFDDRTSTVSRSANVNTPTAHLRMILVSLTAMARL